MMSMYGKGNQSRPTIAGTPFRRQRLVPMNHELMAIWLISVRWNDGIHDLHFFIDSTGRHTSETLEPLIHNMIGSVDPRPPHNDYELVTCRIDVFKAKHGFHVVYQEKN